MKTTNSNQRLTLEDKMTSLRTVSISVLAYIFGYAVKLGFLFSDVLQSVIAHEYLRFPTSFIIGSALSTGLLIVSVNEINKWVPYVIATMDAVVLLLVFGVFEKESPSEIFVIVFLSCFMAYVGFNLISVFVTRYSKEKASHERTITELERVISEKERRRSEIEREITEKEREISELMSLQCPKCERQFKTKNALNAHVGKCDK